MYICGHRAQGDTSVMVQANCKLHCIAWTRRGGRKKDWSVENQPIPSFFRRWRSICLPMYTHASCDTTRPALLRPSSGGCAHQSMFGTHGELPFDGAKCQPNNIQVQFNDYVLLNLYSRESDKCRKTASLIPTAWIIIIYSGCCAASQHRSRRWRLEGTPGRRAHQGCVSFEDRKSCNVMVSVTNRQNWTVISEPSLERN